MTWAWKSMARGRARPGEVIPWSCRSEARASPLRSTSRYPHIVSCAVRGGGKRGAIGASSLSAVDRRTSTLSHKPRSRKVRRAPAKEQVSAKPASEGTPEEQISYSALSLHALFEQQARQLLDRTDLDEEQKQN